MSVQVSGLAGEGRLCTCTLQPWSMPHVHFASDKPPISHLPAVQNLTVDLLHVVCIWVSGQKLTPGLSKQKAASLSDLL